MEAGVVYDGAMDRRVEKGETEGVGGREREGEETGENEERVRYGVRRVKRGDA